VASSTERRDLPEPVAPTIMRTLSFRRWCEGEISMRGQWSRRLVWVVVEEEGVKWVCE